MKQIKVRLTQQRTLIKTKNLVLQRLGLPLLFFYHQPIEMEYMPKLRDLIPKK